MWSEFNLGIGFCTKMGDIITGLNSLMKGYQLELNFDTPENNDDEDEGDENNTGKNTWRGSKDFITDMKSEDEE